MPTCSVADHVGYTKRREINTQFLRCYHLKDFKVNERCCLIKKAIKAVSHPWCRLISDVCTSMRSRLETKRHAESWFTAVSEKTSRKVREFPWSQLPEACRSGAIHLRAKARDIIENLLRSTTGLECDTQSDYCSQWTILLHRNLCRDFYKI